MHETTFKDPAVIREAGGVRFLRVDMTAPDRKVERILESFRIPGAPTILVYGPDGKERQRRIGFVGASEFVEILKDAKGAPSRVPAEQGV
jgi:thiol:disulfide interchange protein DsbD